MVNVGYSQVVLSGLNFYEVFLCCICVLDILKIMLNVWSALDF